MISNPTIVFTGQGQVQIEERKLSDPASGELVIRTLKTLISTGTELTVLQGNEILPGSRLDKHGKYPYLPGYNNIGVVIDAGDDVSKSWLGKKVATYGNHAAYINIPYEKARVVPPDIVDDQAVFFTIAEIVLNGIRRGKVSLGDSVVVFGLGLLGQMAVRICRLCGANPVMGVDVSDSRRELLPVEPSVIPIKFDRENIIEIVSQATKNRMADIVIELTGNASLIPEEFKVLRSQGKFVILSSPRGKSHFDFNDFCSGPSYQIIGAHNSSHPEVATLDNPWTLHRDSELFFTLLTNKELDMTPLISHHANFREAIGIYDMLVKDRSKAMGVILDWDV
ncbi:MAG: zinc-binding alcohol dehydrogenase [Clostridia bacterium]|nr:zinc-binding alcohol dehydrogenase [Clostridia bacterium]